MSHETYFRLAALGPLVGPFLGLAVAMAMGRDLPIVMDVATILVGSLWFLPLYIGFAVIILLALRGCDATRYKRVGIASPFLFAPLAYLFSWLVGNGTAEENTLTAIIAVALGSVYVGIALGFYNLLRQRGRLKGS